MGDIVLNCGKRLNPLSFLHLLLASPPIWRGLSVGESEYRKNMAGEKDIDAWSSLFRLWRTAVVVKLCFCFVFPDHRRTVQ
jgi:hypothetical protein